MVQQYPPNPVQRLVDTRIPDINVERVNNPVLQKVLQLPEFGWHNCTPQMAGVKLRDSFEHIPMPHLVEQVGHAKRWIKEKITTYVDGALIYFLRHAKFIIDCLRIIQYAVRLVATLNYIISLINMEIARAQAWANECIALVGFAKRELTPAHLRTEAERVLAAKLDQAAANISQQITENAANVACFI